MSTPWSNQIKNRNYLSPVGFKFLITKAPKADFFSNSASIPGINLGVALQPGYLRDIPGAGALSANANRYYRRVKVQNLM